MHYAVENNHADVVRILVEREADVYVKDENWMTTLLLAGKKVNRNEPNEMTKFAEIVEILVDSLPHYDKLTRRQTEEFVNNRQPYSGIIIVNPSNVTQ